MIRKFFKTKKFRVFLLSLFTFLLILIVGFYASETYSLFSSLYSTNNAIYSLKQSNMVFFGGNDRLKLAYPNLFNNLGYAGLAFHNSAFYYIFAISLILSASLIIFMFVYFYRLIDKQEGTLSTLKSVEKSILEMPSTILHEIKGNVNSLSINSRVLGARVAGVKDFEGEKGEITRISGAIEAETHKLAQTMENILKFTKDYHLNLEDINLLDLLNFVAETLKPKAVDKGINLLISLDKNISVKMDRDLMEQVFINLLSNAIESYDGEKGDVLIYSSFYLKKVLIIIEDNGKGIKQEIIKKIYEPFFTTKKNGVGLGLALVKKILDAHGFKMNIESNYNKGTKVSVIFKDLEN
ncbi:MAG: HAMP domain-containing sensor histidine kinase [Deltaproteobacteria bacterium]|nr:HAMP domain-containing histidine kinase [Deltaproteobacteria bacterium]MCL5880861.1 HAMP domain-containing histidine kinase [Deltaproteobacteria bacterium]MDA8303755.1 HAMP domain-containing sensor histidine kinase [Deltaproteobacteria bacterium]